MRNKFVILDAGPIISLAMNGLLPVLEALKQKTGVEFIITPEVKREVIDKPLLIKKYAFEGIRVRYLLDKGVLSLSSKYVSNFSLDKETNKIMELANSSFYADRQITLIQKGEASCLAFANLCNCDNLIAVDERTVRMLSESPDSFKKLMENKLHTKISVNKKTISKLADYKFIRSTELLFIAYKKGIFEYPKDRNLLEALLYAVKFNGVAVSSREIEEMKRLA